MVEAEAAEEVWQMPNATIAVKLVTSQGQYSTYIKLRNNAKPIHFYEVFSSVFTSEFNRVSNKCANFKCSHHFGPALAKKLSASKPLKN